MFCPTSENSRWQLGRHASRRSSEITGGAAGRSLLKTGAGTLALTGPNDIDQVSVVAGALRLTGAQVATNSSNQPILFDTNNTTSVLEIDNADGSADMLNLHSGDGSVFQVDWGNAGKTSSNRRDGGFAAHGNDVAVTVADETGAVPSSIQWGNGDDAF
jgi:hypothetical protein